MVRLGIAGCTSCATRGSRQPLMILGQHLATLADTYDALEVLLVRAPGGAAVRRARLPAPGPRRRGRSQVTRVGSGPHRPSEGDESRGARTPEPGQAGHPRPTRRRGHGSATAMLTHISAMLTHACIALGRSSVGLYRTHPRPTERGSGGHNGGGDGPCSTVTKPARVCQVLSSGF